MEDQEDGDINMNGDNSPEQTPENNENNEINTNTNSLQNDIMGDIVVDMGQVLPSELVALLSSALDSPLTPTEESPVVWRFSPGRSPARIRARTGHRPPRRTPSTPISTPSPSSSPSTPEPFLWADRIKHAPAAGYIRPLSDPDTEPNTMLRLWWSRDRTLTQWAEEINGITTARETSGLVRAAYPADHEESCWSLLNRIQRERWLARKVINRMRHRVWMKQVQCNVDLIDMEPVGDRDAIHLTDVANKTVFRFHRRDVFNNLMSNISTAYEMLPTPRAPTNPYTNAALTLGQTIAICQALLQDYARRGRCPPVLFAAFCAAGYDVDKFAKNASSLLAQYAIQGYFKDITPHNSEAIVETIMQLLTEAGIIYAPISIRRWFRQSPPTPLHREWLDMARDYTLYMNLHIQARPTWYSEAYIHEDVRRLYNRTQLPDSVSTRVRNIRSLFNEAAGPGYLSSAPIPVTPLPRSVQALFGIPAAPDPFTIADEMSDAMALIRAALLGPGQNNTTNQRNGGGPSVP